MPGTKAGQLKARQTMIKKFGSEEAYLEFCHQRSAKGGSKTGNKGFRLNRELASTAGAKGGRASRRPKMAIASEAQV